MGQGVREVEEREGGRVIERGGENREREGEREGGRKR